MASHALHEANREALEALRARKGLTMPLSPWHRPAGPASGAQAHSAARRSSGARPAHQRAARRQGLQQRAVRQLRRRAQEGAPQEVHQRLGLRPLWRVQHPAFLHLQQGAEVGEGPDAGVSSPAHPAQPSAPSLPKGPPAAAAPASARVALPAPEAGQGELSQPPTCFQSPPGPPPPNVCEMSASIWLKAAGGAASVLPLSLPLEAPAPAAAAAARPDTWRRQAGLRGLPAPAAVGERGFCVHSAAERPDHSHWQTPGEKTFSRRRLTLEEGRKGACSTARLGGPVGCRRPHHDRGERGAHIWVPAVPSRGAGSLGSGGSLRSCSGEQDKQCCQC